MKYPRAKLFAATSVLLLAILLFIFYSPKVNAPTPPQPASQTVQKAPVPPVSNTAIDDPNSVLIIVNKKRPLPDGFVPGDLSGPMRQETSAHLTQLFTGAKKSGHSLKIISGYRSQADQKSVYDSYVKRDGIATADRYSARARYSEHQTGLAVDVGNGTCDLEICFGATPAGQWLTAHVHEYGFIIRYENGHETLTGYQYEPWHLRYVGTDLSTKIKQSGQTLEQYFGLPAAPNY